MPVNNGFNKDFISIMSNADKSKMPNFMKLFWEEQQKFLHATKTGVRYHPMIIRYCVGLTAKSPATYDHIRYEEKNHTGFLILPSRRRLRDSRNYIRPQRGFNYEVILELKGMVHNFCKQERYVVLLMDEMKIQEDLVWDKHTGELIGYVDLGDLDFSYAALKKPDKVTSHILVFLLRSIVNPLKFTLANFATSNVKAIQLFPLFWNVVGIVEDNCNLQVVAVTSGHKSLI